ncbi:pupal cuticle protein 20-like isoform X2 [Maniola hyperantus]|uniref:pupal cuticle protein 20-like isoform X2 n=1 Tax=Aphantopus hyperantus TaxID=2795564 RepID=UPI001568D026|nr:pupal cuticle protein 20-like [Maniola hyperantus]
MMSKLIILVSVTVALASGARLDHLVQGYNGGGNNAAPFRFENVNNGDGSYRFSYDTPTGISAHESGAPRAAGPEGLAVTAEGGFSYRAPDGQQISLTYTADENGFHPQGSHIPTSPPIPEAILRSLEYNRQHPSNEGSYNGQRNYY